MKFTAALDLDVVAHESADELTVLLDLHAPEVTDRPRPPGALQIVLDRSGSMSGARLAGARAALASVITRLHPSDVFGVVTFDTEAQVVVPAAPLTDKAAASQAVASIEAGGMTDLSSGYLRALRELRRATEDSRRGGTLLIISDGHVNSGVCDPDEFAQITAKASALGHTTSTLGYGNGYDETLLDAISRSGNGNHVFAADPDAAGAAIAAEVDGLLSKSVQAASLTIDCGDGVKSVSLYNDLPVHQTSDASVTVELGDLYSGEQRRLLLRLDVAGMQSLGLATVATMGLTYVESATLTEHTVTLPLTVNVIPGDELSDRVPDPKVRSERLFQQAQINKRLASESFRLGEIDTAQGHLAGSQRLLGEALLHSATEDASAVTSEIEVLSQMQSRFTAETIDANEISKWARESYHQANRKRGRRQTD